MGLRGSEVPHKILNRGSKAQDQGGFQKPWLVGSPYVYIYTPCTIHHIPHTICSIPYTMCHIGILMLMRSVGPLWRSGINALGWSLWRKRTHKTKIPTETAILCKLIDPALFTTPQYGIVYVVYGIWYMVYVHKDPTDHGFWMCI